MAITESEILDFLKKYEDATNTHIFSNVANLIHPNAMYRFTDGDFIGIDAIRTAFESTWHSIKEEAYSLSDVKIVSTDTHSASITYTFNWSGIVDGGRKNGSGRGTNILVRSENGLQCVHEHLST